MVDKYKDITFKDILKKRKYNPYKILKARGINSIVVPEDISLINNDRVFINGIPLSDTTIRIESISKATSYDNMLFDIARAIIQYKASAQFVSVVRMSKYKKTFKLINKRIAYK